MSAPQVSIILLIVISAVVCQYERPYKPSGWRPAGQGFNAHDSPHHSNHHNYPVRIDSSYGPPPHRPGTFDREDLTTTTSTTTPRSREPTPTSNESEEDSQSNPALAIANSFAFNRPVYVYTGFPLQPAFTYFK
ncbi:uncharacterized protein LOC135169484 [Diachasmimorpha longicaudata]|uniref:uncharacterized protein LOC135169484 n=1 Tax=Diachasmimorpha longicaudata TaxID=58733 RepID=UPI0030B8C8BC